MADTIPNIVVAPNTVVDLYANTGLTVGDKLSVRIFGTGAAKLYAGASLSGEPTDATGFRPIHNGDEMFNDEGDAGAFIWSRQGCTVNVKLAV